MAPARMLIAIFCALAAAREAAAVAPWQLARQAGEPVTIHVDYESAPYNIALRVARSAGRGSALPVQFQHSGRLTKYQR